MKKRGISPLIATVLIIGFVIVLGSMVMIWGSDIFNKYKTQTETEAMSKLTCATKVNLNIKEACDLGTSIRVQLESLSDQKINSFIYRAISPSGAAIETENVLLDPFGIKLFYLNYFAVDKFYTKPTKIEILPRVLIDGKEQTCPGTSKEVKPCYILPSLNDLDDWTGATGLIKDNENILATLNTQTINDEIGVYTGNIGITTGTLTITSKEFVIPPGASAFFIRILGSGSISDLTYKLIVYQTEYTGTEEILAPDGITLIGYKFGLNSNAANKPARIEVTKTNGGIVAITNIAYLLE